MLPTFLSKLSTSAEYTIDDIISILEKISDSMSPQEALEYIEELKNEVDNLESDLNYDSIIEWLNSFTNLPSRGKTVLMAAAGLGVLGLIAGILMAKATKPQVPQLDRKRQRGADLLAAATLEVSVN